jgi:hypothetical protein
MRPAVTLDARGKRQRRYKAEGYATPYEKLKSLPKAAQFLKPRICFPQLDRLASAMSDTECARKMATAKARLLRRCKTESPPSSQVPLGRAAKTNSDRRAKTARRVIALYSPLGRDPKRTIPP